MFEGGRCFGDLFSTTTTLQYPQTPYLAHLQLLPRLSIPKLASGVRRGGEEPGGTLVAVHVPNRTLVTIVCPDSVMRRKGGNEIIVC
jgi:hypothetical protein